MRIEPKLKSYKAEKAQKIGHNAQIADVRPPRCKTAGGFSGDGSSSVLHGFLWV